MNINSDGWLYSGSSIKCLGSPNCDERPDESDICLIVVHGISLPPDQFGGPYIEQLFCNQLNADEHEYFAEIAHLKVSSHVLIRRDGEIVQFVSFLNRAWHAGVSVWNQRERCNDFSIGIELEGADLIEYTDEQYEQLNVVIETLKNHYPKIQSQHIVGHNDIAPGRKTDPGEAFDWQRVNK